MLGKKKNARYFFISGHYQRRYYDFAFEAMDGFFSRNELEEFVKDQLVSDELGIDRNGKVVVLFIREMTKEEYLKWIS